MRENIYFAMTGNWKPVSEAFPSELDHILFMSTWVTLIAFAYIYKIHILLFNIFHQVKSKKENDQKNKTKLVLNESYKYNGEDCYIITKKWYKQFLDWNRLQGSWQSKIFLF